MQKQLWKEDLPLVKFSHVTRKYGNTVAVKDLNLKIAGNEFVVLIGPSGCGKTTTLKMVNRLINPTSGTIEVMGKNIQDLNPVTLRREIGYVIQQVGLFPNMTIAENIGVVPHLLGWDKNKSRKRAAALLTMVGMDPETYMDRYPTELSGGQQQRIGVLRALAADPPLILMDEPFGALDPITRETLQDEFKRLQTELHKTIIFVTHDIDEALKLADRIVIMRAGEVVQDATPEELLRHPADDFVAAFLGKDRLSNQELQVAQVMLENPVKAYPEMGMAEGLALMKRKKVDTVLITDHGGRFLGSVSVDEVNAKHRSFNTLGEIVDQDTPAIEKTAAAKDAFNRINEEKLPYLPVIDEKGLLVGIVTRNNMVNALASVVWGDNNGSS
ncbi:MAG: ABC transporter ATP-binding protein [Heliobacteriaceae bacterium]|nr:ABC transporter ATP-binding protein [Heliobacteriaceae bacterium]